MAIPPERIADSKKIDTMIADLKNADPHIRRNAVDHLRNASTDFPNISSVISALANAFSDGNAEIKEAAAWALEDFAQPRFSLNISRAMHPLAMLLGDENEQVRWRASTALGNAASNPKTKKPAMRLLIKALSDLPDNTAHVRNSAAIALRHAASWNNADISEAVPALKKALKDRDNGVKENAKYALEAAHTASA